MGFFFDYDFFVFFVDGFVKIWCDLYFVGKFYNFGRYGVWLVFKYDGFF